MGKKIPLATKEKVIYEWLQAKPRNIIADELNISYGSVTNIIEQVKKDSIKDIDLLRAVAGLLKKNNLDLTHFALSIRLKNKLDDLEISETKAELFFENALIYCFQKEIEPEEFFIQINSVCFTSEYCKIPLEDLSGFIEGAKEKENKIK
jgi:hypothetical protein